jgi:heptaprenyl diphosphate synthase
MRGRISTRALCTLALTVSVAMILSYIESLVPPLMAVPGVKIGLANIATVFALYTLGPIAAAIVSILRVLLSALLFGNAVALIYSLSGAALSLIFMIIIRRVGIFSAVGVGVVGGVMHNAGQIIAAALILGTAAIVSYLPVLVISGTLAGIIVGGAAGLLAARLKGKIGG